ncbi:hypothetical protein TH25_12010 [Thalassospira profundimaris]|uniref:Uncharacterized protein n=1 Tax=Thalassospira profundimaris TaxID=502049 RepID=A0A367X9P5_9PROT|nr:hypothetical protein TH25_12010 [Thalassospira profundimaris]
MLPRTGPAQSRLRFTCRRAGGRRYISRFCVQMVAVWANLAYIDGIHQCAFWQAKLLFRQDVQEPAAPGRTRGARERSGSGYKRRVVRHQQG